MGAAAFLHVLLHVVVIILQDATAWQYPAIVLDGP